MSTYDETSIEVPVAGEPPPQDGGIDMDRLREYESAQRASEEVDAQAEVNALDLFLSGDPNRPKDTLRLRIDSLSRMGARLRGVAYSSTYIVVRELDEVELNEITERANPTARAGQAQALRDQSDLDFCADLVATALVEPNLAPHMDAMHAKYGVGHSVPRLLKLWIKPLELKTVAQKVLTLSGFGEEAVSEAGN